MRVAEVCVLTGRPTALLQRRKRCIDHRVVVRSDANVCALFQPATTLATVASVMAWRDV